MRFQPSRQPTRDFSPEPSGHPDNAPVWSCFLCCLDPIRLSCLGHQLGARGDREQGERDVDYLQGADLGRNRDRTHFSDIGQRGRCEPHGVVRLWSASY